MTHKVASRVRKRPAPLWRIEEWGPRALVTSLATGLLLYGVGIMPVLAFAALVYSGPLAGQLSAGLGFALLGSAILCGVIALLSSYPGSIAIAQDAPAVLLSITAIKILEKLPPGATQVQNFASITLMLTVAAAVAGFAFLVLGVFKLAGLVRFLPFPVVGGFLAGTGWLLIYGGIGVMVGDVSVLELAQPAVLLRWLPAVLLGVFMLLLVTRANSALMLPLVSAAIILAFYLVVLVTGSPHSLLVEQGWLLGPFPSGRLWESTSAPATLLQNVEWRLVVDQLPSLAALIVVTVIALLLNASAIELIARRDVDMNRELVAAGIANLALSLTGGLVGYPAISLTTLNHTLSGGKRLPGLLTAVLFGATALFGVGLLGLIPKLVLGALIVYLGLGLLYQWIYRAWFTFSHTDYAIIVMIAVVVAIRGFLDGIAVGLVFAVIVFVVSSSRARVVKHALTAAEYRSRVSRDPHQERIVRAHADEIYVLELQGTIFFGTANALYERLREPAVHHDSLAPRFVVLDFAHVTGLDSTGLLSFQKMLQLAHERGFVLVLSGLSQAMRGQFGRNGFIDNPRLLRIFGDLDHGLEWCENELIAAYGTQSHADPSLGSEPADPRTLMDRLQMFVRPENHVERLMSNFQIMHVAAGEHVISQGDDSDLLYFIESGQLTAQLETPGQAPVRLQTMRSGHVVGELGFYLGGKRTAAVVADEPSTVYGLSREELNHIEQTDPEAASMLHRVIVHLVGERVVHLIRSVEALQR